MGSSVSSIASFFEWSSRTAAVVACIAAALSVNLIYREPLTQQPPPADAGAASPEMIETWRGSAARAWRPLLIGYACHAACVAAFTAPFLTNAAGWVIVETTCDEGRGCSSPYNIFTFIYYAIAVTPMLPGIIMLAMSTRGVIRTALRTRQFAVFGVAPPFPGSFRVNFLKLDESAPSLASLSMLGTVSVALGLLLTFIPIFFINDASEGVIAPFYAFYLVVLGGLSVGTTALTIGSRALYRVPHLGAGSAPQLSMQLGIQGGGYLQFFLCPAEFAASGMDGMEEVVVPVPVVVVGGGVVPVAATESQHDYEEEDTPLRGS